MTRMSKRDIRKPSAMFGGAFTNRNSIFEQNYGNFQKLESFFTFSDLQDAGDGARGCR